MVMLLIAYLSIWSYQGHVRYLRESKSYLFYLHATSKNEILICSNKHGTGLVHMITSTKRITKALIRLCGCAGWSAPVLFANPGRQVFSRRGPIKSPATIRQPASRLLLVTIYNFVVKFMYTFIVTVNESFVISPLV